MTVFTGKVFALSARKFLNHQLAVRQSGASFSMGFAHTW